MRSLEFGEIFIEFIQTCREAFPLICSLAAKPNRLAPFGKFNFSKRPCHPRGIIPYAPIVHFYVSFPILLFVWFTLLLLLAFIF